MQWTGVCTSLRSGYIFPENTLGSCFSSRGGSDVINRSCLHALRGLDTLQQYSDSTPYYTFTTVALSSRFKYCKLVQQCNNTTPVLDGSARSRT